MKLSVFLWLICPTSLAIDCGMPEVLSNGTFTLLNDGTTYNKSVLYGCEPNFALVGDQQRFCTLSTTWSGSMPKCVGEEFFSTYSFHFFDRLIYWLMRSCLRTFILVFLITWFIDWWGRVWELWFPFFEYLIYWLMRSCLRTFTFYESVEKKYDDWFFKSYQ